MPPEMQLQQHSSCREAQRGGASTGSPRPETRDPGLGGKGRFVLFKRHAHNYMTKSKGLEQVESKKQKEIMRENITMTTADE